MTLNILPNYFSNFKSDATKRSYMNVFNDFANYIKKDILSASPKDCLDFLDHLNDTDSLKKSTRIKKRKQLSSLYTYLQENAKKYDLGTFDNIFTDLLPPQVREEIRFSEVPTLFEIDRLIGYLKKNDWFTLCAVLFAFRTFLSTEEIRNLTVDNIIMTKDSKVCVQIKNIRNKELRYNVIPPDMAIIISKYIGSLPVIPGMDQAHRKLFANLEGEVPPQKTFRNRLKKAWKQIGVNQSYSFNNLRNAGVVYAVSNNADITSVADALGYQQVTHLKRLESLPIKLNTATEYVNIQILN